MFTEPAQLGSISKVVDLREAVDDDRVLIFPFPRSVVKETCGHVFQPLDLNLSVQPAQVRDITLSMFMLHIFGEEKVMLNLVDSAYVDLSNKEAVVFYLVLKKKNLHSLAEFTNFIGSVLQSNASVCNSWEAAPAVAGDEPEGSDEPPTKKAKTPKPKPAPRAGKGKDFNPFPDAHRAISRPDDDDMTISIDNIVALQGWPGPMGFGRLITSDWELTRDVRSFIKSRFRNLGYSVDDPVTVDDDSYHTGMSAKTATFNLKAPEVSFGSWPTSGELEVSIDIIKYLNVKNRHPCLTPFVHPSFLATRLFTLDDTNIKRFKCIRNDFCSINCRTLVPHLIYNDYNNFRARLTNEQTSTVANPPGDIQISTNFFGKREDYRRDKPAAIRFGGTNFDDCSVNITAESEILFKYTAVPPENSCISGRQSIVRT